MATLDDLANLASENPQVREDLIATLSAFCERHSIDVTAEVTRDDCNGYALSPPTSIGQFVAMGIKANPVNPVNPVNSGPGHTYDVRQQKAV